LPSCQVLRWQASRQPHPPPTLRSPSLEAVMLRITPSGLPGPLPSAPRGLPLVSLYHRAVTAPRFATGLSRPWDSGFCLLSFAPATGRPRFARTPRSRAHFPSPPGRRRRPLRGDCFAPAACRTFSLSPSRQTSLRSDCLGGCYRSDRRDPPAASPGTGHGFRLLFLLVLREAADTCCAVTAASLRSSFFPALPPGDLASLGRPEAGLF